jgi:drug/metabolite transporter (DMT)-like permease
MPQAQTKVEEAIFNLSSKIFAKIVNPLVVLFVILGITIFLWIIFKYIYKKSSGQAKDYRDLWWPLMGLTIMLSAIGITYFIGNTGNEVFQGSPGGDAVKGINEVVQPIQIR